MNSVLRRLGSGEHWWAAEAVLRSLGLALLGLCAAAVLWLHQSIRQPTTHEVRPGELLAGLVAVEGWCLGSVLLVEGQGLFRLMPVPGFRGRLSINPKGNSQ